MSTGQRLPTELVDRIFKLYLTQESLGHCSLVCFSWRQLALPLLFKSISLDATSSIPPTGTLFPRSCPKLAPGDYIRSIQVRGTIGRGAGSLDATMDSSFHSSFISLIPALGQLEVLRFTNFDFEYLRNSHDPNVDFMQELATALSRPASLTVLLVGTKSFPLPLLTACPKIRKLAIGPNNLKAVNFVHRYFTEPADTSSRLAFLAISDLANVGQLADFLAEKRGRFSLIGTLKLSDGGSGGTRGDVLLFFARILTLQELSSSLRTLSLSIHYCGEAPLAMPKVKLQSMKKLRRLSIAQSIRVPSTWAITPALEATELLGLLPAYPRLKRLDLTYRLLTRSSQPVETYLENLNSFLDAQLEILARLLHHFSTSFQVGFEICFYPDPGQAVSKPKEFGFPFLSLPNRSEIVSHLQIWDYRPGSSLQDEHEARIDEFLAHTTLGF